MTNSQDISPSNDGKKQLAFIVVQPSFSHYREPFVKQLLKNDRFGIELAGRRTSSEGTKKSTQRDASNDMAQQVKPLRRVKLVGPFFWDVGLAKQILDSQAQIVVLEGNIFNISTWAAAIFLRLRRKTLLYWGHGWKRYEKGAKLAIRKTFYRISHGHLVYGVKAKEFAKAVGLDDRKFYPVFNSFLEAKDVGLATAPGKTDHGHRSLRLIFSGRLTPRHAVSDALQAVVQVRSQGWDVRLTVIGDGPEGSKLRELAQNDPESVDFLGPIYSLERLRQAYANADVAVSPGASGLNVIQALGFGVPVIAAAGNPESGPEIEAVRHMKTGILYEPAVQELSELIQGLIEPGKTDPLRRMSENALDLVHERYTAEAHASAVVEALEHIGWSD